MATKTKPTLADYKFTVRDAAERFNRNPSRIRQICLAHDIGFKWQATTDRMLTESDIEAIGKIIEERGHSRAN